MAISSLIRYKGFCVSSPSRMSDAECRCNGVLKPRPAARWPGRLKDGGRRRMFD
jgi:hypothetical protein